MLSWPSSSWTAFSDAPRMTRWLANVCRSPCVVMRFESFARVHVEGTTSFTIEWLRQCFANSPSVRVNA